MGKVLIVENNELNLKLFRDLVMILGHSISVSRDGIGVVEIVLKERPDLILMDIHLDRISGIDIIQDLKKNKQTKKIPVIAITAFAMQNDRDRISKSGCDLYLSKPIEVESLFGHVDKFINAKTL